MGNTLFAIGTLGVGPLIVKQQEAQTQQRQFMAEQRAQQDKLLAEAKDQAAKEKQAQQDAGAVAVNRQRIAASGTPYGTGGGYRSTILTGPLGVPNSQTTAPKTLLGA